jgi:hypothetical protein
MRRYKDSIRTKSGQGRKKVKEYPIVMTVSQSEAESVTMHCGN